MTMFDREQILGMIPHSGSMCLLDAVLNWDEVSLRCLSSRYRLQDNPMRRANGILGTVCGVEIAAQTVAVHCRLLATARGAPQHGYLVSLRDVKLRAQRLDAIEGDLIIDAERMAGDAISATYHFGLAVQGIKLLSGRVTVLLGRGPGRLRRRFGAETPGSNKSLDIALAGAGRMSRALVTGGSGAIGGAIAAALAAAGSHVYVHANARLQQAQAVCASIIANGGTAEAVCFDVTNATATQAALLQLLQAGPIQIVVNNAGIHDDAIMPGMRPEQWSRVIDVSLNGFFNVTQPLLLPMLRTRWGRIINISSVAAIMGNRGQANYAAAKAGLHGAARSLALELASRGITVNTVAPGIIASPAIEGVFPQDAIDKLVPMKRAGRPEEVAGLVAYLASDRAGYISGQQISINGGMA